MHLSTNYTFKDKVTIYLRKIILIHRYKEYILVWWNLNCSELAIVVEIMLSRTPQLIASNVFLFTSGRHSFKTQFDLIDRTGSTRTRWYNRASLVIGSVMHLIRDNPTDLG